MNASGSASCRTARNALSAQTATISGNAAPTGSNAYSLVAAKIVRYRMPTPPPCSTRPYAARRARTRQPIASSAAAASAVPARRNSIGSMSLSAAYFSRNATPKNSTMIPTRTTVLPPSSQSRAAPNARSAMPGSRGAGGAGRAGAAGGIVVVSMEAGADAAGRAAVAGASVEAGAGAEVEADVPARATAGCAGGTGGVGECAGSGADVALAEAVCAMPPEVAAPAVAPASCARSASSSRVSVSTVASRRATRSASGNGGGGVAETANASGVARGFCCLRCRSACPTQNPTAAPSSEPLPAEKSPIKAAMPPTMKPITANAQFNALLPLTIVIVLRSRIAPDRGGFSTAGRRTGMRAPCGSALVRKARGIVAIGVFAGNVSQRARAEFRG